MKFIVFIKQVPDTAAVSVDEKGNLIRQGMPSILNPYCEYALDMACRLKKEEDTIFAVTMGPPQAKEALLRCLELGADEAFLLTDSTFAGADVHATARTLSAFVTKFIPNYDIIFCGKQAIDGDTAQVPAELAVMLDVAQFCYVEDMSITEMTVVQNYEDEIRKCTIKSGSIVSVSKGEINPRLPSISDHIKAKGKEIKTINRVELGLGTFSVGTKGSKTKIIESKTSKISRTGTVTDGTDAKHAAEYILETMR